MHNETNTRTTESLVPDPHRGTGIDLESGKQARTNSGERCSDKHERGVIPNDGDTDTTKDREDSDAENKREVTDAGLGRGDALDCLEPDRKIEYEQHEARADGESNDGSGGDRALFNDAWGNGGFLATPELDANKGNEEDGGADKEPDYGGRGPCIFRATPLEREEEGDDTGKEDGGADKVELLDLVGVGKFVGLCTIRRRKEKRDDDDGHSTNWQVDVETPSPRCVISEGTTHERAGDTSNSEHGANEASVHRAFTQWDRVSEDDQGAREDSGAT